jgi:hypothetical protein
VPWVEPVAGTLLMGLVLADVFLTILYARAGTGIISNRLAKLVWLRTAQACLVSQQQPAAFILRPFYRGRDAADLVDSARARGCADCTPSTRHEYHKQQSGYSEAMPSR